VSGMQEEKCIDTSPFRLTMYINYGYRYVVISMANYNVAYIYDKMNLAFTESRNMVVVLLLLSVYIMHTKHYKLLLVPAAMFAFILYFFRNPATTIMNQSTNIIAPSYGTIQRISETKDSYNVSIFLSVTDVHVQYVPVNGTVVSQQYKEGQFHPAYILQKSERNEQMEHTFDTVMGTIKVRQIAGLVARRIVSYVSVGDSVMTGQRLGMIKFGSRVDIEIPKDGIELVCAKGQKLVGGVTVIAKKVVS